MNASHINETDTIVSQQVILISVYHYTSQALLETRSQEVPLLKKEQHDSRLEQFIGVCI